MMHFSARKLPNPINETLFAVVAASIGFCPVSSPAKIIRVPADQPSIQLAIDAAVAGDTVLVQPNTYVENIDFKGLDIVVGSLFLTTGDTSYVSTTIIDGDSAGTVVTFPSGSTQAAILTGFTIRNGLALSGGGIRCLDAGPTIEHNRIIRNIATPGTSNGGLGGGIYCLRSAARIVNNEILFNEGNGLRGVSGLGIGGGIYCIDSSPLISGNLIDGNSAKESGGGIYYKNSSGPITNNTIINNQGGGLLNGGGGISCVRANPDIADNVIKGNSSTFGGGIYCLDAAPIIRGNTITGNAALGDGQSPGGGICCDGGSPTIRANVIRDNSGREGGGISCGDQTTAVIVDNRIERNRARSGAGIYCTGVSDVLILGNLIKGNLAMGIGLSRGGGILCGFNAAPKIIGNVIVGNTADSGGGIVCSGSNANPVISRCVISTNSSESGGDGISCSFNSPVITNTILWGNRESEIFGGTPVVTYCNIRGGFEGEGNIDADPLFVNAFRDDYNTCMQSPCIDAGDPDSLDSDLTRADIGLYFPGHPECFAGSTWHVSVGGSDLTGTGTLANPFETIQHAIDKSLHGDTVIVQRGTYVENVNIVSKNVVLSSTYLPSGDTLAIMGTIVDGNRSGPGVSYRLCDQTSILIGFTIRNADTEGGVRCTFFASPTIRFNAIRDNHGSGIYCEDSDPRVTSNVIVENTATSGGGIYCVRSRPIVTSNIIGNNRASRGGGVYAVNRSSLTLSDNAILSNSAGVSGGGIYFSTSTAPKVRDNIIAENVVSGFSARGGGIYSSQSSPVITGNTIYGNLVLGIETFGSALYFSNSSATVKRCIIVANSNSYLFGSTVNCAGSGSASVSCTDIFGNVGGDWTHCIAGQAEQRGNFSADPLFCDPASSDFRIGKSSPCASENNSCRQLIGAGEVGCTVVGPDDDEPLVINFVVDQNHPNPFTRSTTIEYTVPVQARVTITIYNVAGQVVTKLVNEIVPAGPYTTTWNGLDSKGNTVSSGVYFYELRAGGRHLNRKMILVR